MEAQWPRHIQSRLVSSDSPLQGLKLKRDVAVKNANQKCKMFYVPVVLFITVDGFEILAI